MKFNWGTGIALFYGLFMAVLVFAVFKTTQYDHSLVTKEYYKEDINYQQHYDKVKNSQALETDLLILPDARAREITLYFPKDLGAVQGDILIYRPSSSDLDQKISIQPQENNSMVIPVQSLQPGYWKIKVDWQADGKPYFKETDFTI